MILARHGLRLLQLLDDTPVVPGDVRAPYAHGAQARQVLNDAEDDLKEWRLDGTLLNDEAKDAAVAEAATPPVTAKSKDKGKQKEEPKEQTEDDEAGEGGG